MMTLASLSKIYYKTHTHNKQNKEKEIFIDKTVEHSKKGLRKFNNVISKSKTSYLIRH